MKSQRRAILLVFIFIVFKILGIYLVNEIFGVEFDNLYITYFTIYIESIVFFITLIIYYRRFRGEGFKKNSWREIGIYLPYFLICMIFLIIVLAIGENRRELNIMLVTQIFATSLLMGISEELIFRCMLLKVFNEKWKMKTAALINAVMFSMVGITNALGGADIEWLILNMGTYFLLGLSLAVLANSLNNIFPLIICRCIWGLTFMLGVILGVDVTGISIILSMFIVIYSISCKIICKKINA